MGLKPIAIAGLNFRSRQLVANHHRLIAIRKRAAAYGLTIHPGLNVPKAMQHQLYFSIFRSK